MKFLGYEKSSILGYNTGNSRNGFYERDLDTSYGRLYIKVPRDRNGHFEQQLIPDYARRTDELETTLITLYKKGITTREISGGNPKKHLHYKFTQKTFQLRVIFISLYGKSQYFNGFRVYLHPFSRTASFNENNALTIF